MTPRKNLLNKLSPTATFVLVSSVGLILILIFEMAMFLKDPSVNTSHMVKLASGEFELIWHWNNGNEAPTVMLNGEDHLAISANDSFVRIGENKPFYLWNHIMGVDHNNSTLFSSYNRRGDYLIEQSVSIIDSKTIEIRYLVTSLRYIRSLDLHVVHKVTGSRVDIAEAKSYGQTSRLDFEILKPEGTEASAQYEESSDGIAFNAKASVYNLFPQKRTPMFTELITLREN